LGAGELGSVSVIWGAAGGWVSTVKERDTTTLSFPGASIALTAKVWMPSESDASVFGEVQLLKGLALTRDSKVEPASFEANLKVGVGLLMTLPWLGPEVMVAVLGDWASRGRVLDVLTRARARRDVAGGVPCLGAEEGRRVVGDRDGDPGRRELGGGALGNL
jgi:hypothetical protein